MGYNDYKYSRKNYMHSYMIVNVIANRVQKEVQLDH